MTAAHPLRWPVDRPRTRAPQRSQFATSFAQARDGLLDEIRLLGGKDAVIT